MKGPAAGVTSARGLAGVASAPGLEGVPLKAGNAVFGWTFLLV